MVTTNWEHTKTHTVVYLKATAEASLTVRAICPSLVKQEQQPCQQLSNPNTMPAHLLALSLSLSLSLPLYITKKS